MTTYNVGDFFLYTSPINQPRYLGVIIQKNPPVDKDEPRLLILAGIKDERMLDMYSAGHASLDTQDRLIDYIIKTKNQNSDEDFNKNDFLVFDERLGASTPTCARFGFKRLTFIKDTSSLEDTFQKLGPFMYGAEPERIIRFFQRIHRPFNSLTAPNLSL